MANLYSESESLQLDCRMFLYDPGNESNWVALTHIFSKKMIYIDVYYKSYESSPDLVSSYYLVFYSSLSNNK